MRTGQVAKQSGLSQSQIDYWAKMGYIRRKRKGNYWVYNKNSLEDIEILILDKYTKKEA